MRDQVKDIYRANSDSRKFDVIQVLHTTYFIIEFGGARWHCILRYTVAKYPTATFTDKRYESYDIWQRINWKLIVMAGYCSRATVKLWKRIGIIKA